MQLQGLGEQLDSLIPAAANVVQAETACREFNRSQKCWVGLGVADLLAHPFWQNIEGLFPTYVLHIKPGLCIS